jgi:hypothetical protein
VRDLRQWYITFGKRAIREGLPMTDIVSVAFVRATAAAAVTARRDATVHERRRGVVDMIAAGAGAAPLVGALGASGGSAGAPLGASGSWAAAAGAGAGAPAPHVPGPLVLPNGMLEFQVRLTADEYAAVALARRKMEAEAKYTARIAAAKERAAALKAGADRWGAGGGGGAGAGAGAGGDGGADGGAAPVPLSIFREGSYEDPAARNAYFYRSP